MSAWSRIRNVFRREALAREIEDELADHAADGGRIQHPLRIAEHSRDVRLMPWLDSIAADIVFGWRQLKRNPVATAAAVISLGLAIGSATSAFRLIDALLLRPLPIAHPENLFLIATQFEDAWTKTQRWTYSCSYPQFREFRASLDGQSTVLLLGLNEVRDITYGSETDLERAARQYVSGDVFPVFGLKPALGRLLTPEDDRTPGAHPVAVISYDYWERRFGRDPNVIGKTFRQDGAELIEIVGVVEKGFTGTEPGSMTDYFVPAMQNAKRISDDGWMWFRPWVVAPEAVRHEIREKLRTANSHYWAERQKTMPAHIRRNNLANQVVELLPAHAGISALQNEYRRSLWALAAVVALVLLIACANVANLMTAQAATRAREMALRVSIGAGRRRLMQLVLIEGAIVALMATLAGGLFAWWSAPFVVGLISSEADPVSLALPADWRILGFSVLLALLVTALFGLAPAWKASSVKPVLALKGGEDRFRRRLMSVLVVAQVAFCFLVHFTAGLFVATFDRLSHQPLGFDPAGVLTLETSARGDQGTWAAWNEVLEAVKARPDVESAALADWALLSGNISVGGAIVNGEQLAPPPYYLSVSPGWFATMRLPLLAGRDFRPGERFPEAAIVNESFARKAFGSDSPLGKHIRMDARDGLKRAQIIGVAADARYADMREAIQPTVYVPAEREGEGKAWATIVVRAGSGKPEALAADLRAAIHRTRKNFQVSNAITQIGQVRKHTVRERLVSMLSLFFAGVALILAAVGLYGVLNYSVLQRRREIGIRMALGAQPTDVIRRVASEVFAMLVLGSLAGLALGLWSEHYVETLLFNVKATDLRILATPAVMLAAAAILAAVPPILRAVRIDPAETLRAE